MVAFYLFTLALSSGIVAAFGRHVLTSAGLMAGFESTLYFVLGLATAYAATQFMYMCMIQFFYPTRSPGPYATESTSHATALILLPYLLRIDVPWPHSSMDAMEPLIYASSFVALHLMLKLATFYAALRGDVGRRLPSAWWLAGTLACAPVAYLGFSTWFQQVSDATSPTPSHATTYRVGDQYARAMAMPEGTVSHHDLASYPGQRLTLRWAPLPDAIGPTTIYVTVTLYGTDTKTYSASPKLHAGRWTEMGVSGRFIPENLTSCAVQWSTRPVPSWSRLLGIRPISRRTTTLGAAVPKVLFSGPLQHEMRPDSKGKNVLLVAIDAFGADHVSMMGYAKNTTPSFDRLGQRAVVFENAFTPTPEAMGAYMSLVTGVDPLRHGYFAGRLGPPPSHTLAELLANAKYATAAFTEGARGDLIKGSGFERGFELLDTSYVQDGSATTLSNVRRWISSMKDVKFFAFVRLSALSSEEQRREPRDHYDDALSKLDGRLGALLKFLRDQDGGKNTVIIITSAYGLNPGTEVGLHEPSLHVPLLIYAPGTKASLRKDLASILDIAPTILAIAGISPPRTMTGHDLLSPTSRKNLISVFGDPIALSLRTEKWRYSWQSGIGLSGVSGRTTPQGLGLFYYAYDDPDWWKKDLTIEYPSAVRDYTRQLRDYIQGTQP